jgi:hypothetical protein
MEVAIVIAACLVLFVIAVKVYDKKNPAFLATEYHPELEADYQEKKVKGVSEPVYAFVRAVKENPKRFKLIREWDNAYSSGMFINYNFKDKQENKTWRVTVSTWYNREDTFIHGPRWLTDEERKYIYKAFEQIFKVERIERLHTIQRRRMSRVYK